MSTKIKIGFVFFKPSDKSLVLLFLLVVTVWGSSIIGNQNIMGSPFSFLVQIFNFQMIGPVICLNFRVYQNFVPVISFKRKTRRPLFFLPGEGHWILDQV